MARASWTSEELRLRDGMSGSDAAYILESFPIIRRKDMETYGELMTARRILDFFDRLATDASWDGLATSLVDPPTAHASCRCELPGSGPA